MPTLSEMEDDALWRALAESAEAILSSARLKIAIPLGCPINVLQEDEERDEIQSILKSTLLLSDRVAEIIYEFDRRLQDSVELYQTSADDDDRGEQFP